MDPDVAEVLCSGQEQESESNEGSSTTETTGSTKRVLGDEDFDRDRIIQDHELHRLVYSYMVKKPLDLGSEPNSYDEHPVLSVEQMAVITLPDLVLETRHSNRVLYGRLCVIPFRKLAIHTVLEDTAGRAVRVAIYNAVSSSASQREAAKRFPSGMHVAIREPFFSACEGGRPVVLADNPADIVPVQTGVQLSDCADQIRETLEKIRAEGNELLLKRDWIGAASKYTACIDRASGITITDRDTQRDCLRNVALAYANRAEVRLRLKKYDDALNDSTKALNLDPKQMKTLLRKGTAENALGLFQSAAKTVADASAAASNEEDRSSISRRLKEIVGASLQSQQSRYGYFDLTNFYLKGELSPCADFVGPVEIRKTSYGSGRRGLFATRNVASGQILLVSNPLAIARENVDTSPDPSGKRSLALEAKMDEDMLAQLLKRARNSKRCLAQLYSLGMNDRVRKFSAQLYIQSLNEPKEMEIPSMELFTPGSEWVPPGMDNLKVEAEKLALIGETNAFTPDGALTSGTEKGLWALPAFANHSCAPNCIMVMVGEAMFFRAAREIVDGSELTIAYVHTFDSRERRREQILTIDLTCECERCRFEGALLTRLPKLDVSDRTELARTADKVEGMIQSCPELESRQQSWIRAAYMCAYNEKYELGIAEDNAQSRISTLTLMTEAMVAVSVYPTALNFSAMLLFEVEGMHSDVGSEEVSRTEERVLEIYSNFYGMAPKKFLLNMIQCSAKGFNSAERAHMAQIMCRPMQR